MLEGLDSVDWGRLTHAYGDAADVPDLIRALASDDEGERGEALDELFGNIWHQGTVYEATAFAVPFLIELLADASVEGKGEILPLLACIAEGHSYIDVHAGLLDRMGTGPRSSQEEADREAELARELGWVRAAREAVEAGVGTYLDLLDDDDPEVAVQAAYALGRCRGRAAQVVPELVARVPSAEDALSQAALILALGSLEADAGGRGEVAGLLAGRIGPEQPPVVRLAAAMGLARASADEPAPRVLEALAASTGAAWGDFEDLPWCDGDVAVTVGEALAEHPRAQSSFLLALLDAEDEEVRRGARYALEALCQQRRPVTAPIAAALGERVLIGDLADRRGTVAVLSRLGSSAALAARPLGVALDDDDPQVRGHAAVALAGLRDPRAIPTLVALLDEDHLFPRIAEALGRFGAAARDAVPALLDVLGRKPPREPLLSQNRPIQVAAALGRIGPEARAAVPALIALLKKQPHTRMAAALALGQIDGTEARAAVRLLKKLLGSRDELVQIRAAQALWQIDRRADQVLPVLIELLQPNRTNRAHVAEVLGEMGEPAREAGPALRACLDAGGFHAMWIQLEAARALWRIERAVAESLPVLIGLLREPRAVGALVATRAAETLGEMGGLAREAVPMLRAAAEGDLRPFGGLVDEIVIQDEAFCSAAAEALRRIEGDR